MQRKIAIICFTDDIILFFVEWEIPYGFQYDLDENVPGADSSQQQTASFAETRGKK